MILDYMLFEESYVDSLYEASQPLRSHKNIHLHHIEDRILDGDDGHTSAIDTLLKTHEYLKGNNPKGFSLKTKFDGSPSIVWGHHPQTGKFFVGTKSFFNKNPKINHSDSDIDANHGNSKTLANKLKYLLHHLKKVTKNKGVYQGDLMYTADDINQDGKNLSFTPNTITYNIDKDSHHGKKILNSKIGIAPHTRYEAKPNGDLHAVYDLDPRHFEEHPDIHFFPTSLRGPFDYKSSDIKPFHSNLTKASEYFHKIRDHEIFTKHQDLLKRYLNHTVRARQEPNATGYVAFLHREFSKKSDKIKNDSTRNSHKTALANETADILKNKTEYNNLFKAHRHLQIAKNVLVNVLSKNSPYNETILGQKSKPEGFVANVNGVPHKLVDRDHFSAANFDFNDPVDPADNPLVLHFGRFQGVTKGHEKMVNKGADIARRIGAKQKIVATSTKGGKNNPLTPSQKMQWLKTMFPGADIGIAGDKEHTLIAQLQHLHNQGTRDLTIVAGSDRIDQFKNILSKYNGKGKLFNFRRARVISAGERDPEGTPEEKSSGTELRQAAKKGDLKSFKSMLPEKGKSKANDLYHDMRASLGVKIDMNTPGEALAKYRERQDKIGQDARHEIERRKRIGTWRGI